VPIKGLTSLQRIYHTHTHTHTDNFHKVSTVRKTLIKMLLFTMSTPRCNNWRQSFNSETIQLPDQSHPLDSDVSMFIFAIMKKAPISSISYRPITLVGSSRMHAILTRRACASFYCSFTPLSLTGHIAQWQAAPALCYRSRVRSRGGIITFYLFSYWLHFLSHFSLYYCHLFSLTSIYMIIYICWQYESLISMQKIRRYDFLIYC